MERIKILANHNGIQRIKEKMKEECGELIEAVENNVEYEIVDEVADVLVVAQQLIYKMNIWNEVESRMKYKIDRTMKKEGII